MGRNMKGVLDHDSALVMLQPGLMRCFVMNHAPCCWIARLFEQQSSVLPLYHEYPLYMGRNVAWTVVLHVYPVLDACVMSVSSSFNLPCCIILTLVHIA